VSAEEIVSFLRSLTDGRKQFTKHARYSHLRTLFNFIRANLSPGLPNPCDAPMMLEKLFPCRKPVQWDILEKETVDEIIFRTTKLRNRITLELMKVVRLIHESEVVERILLHLGCGKSPPHLREPKTPD
jgi:integrase/recombinase XerD